MRQIFVRPARKEDFDRLIRWGNANPAWDERALEYSFTWAAFSGTDVVAYMPVQRPELLEAIAFNPLATDIDKALAMKELTHTIICDAYQKGAGEIMFLGSEPITNVFAARQGFMRVDLPLYRARLRELEKSPIQEDGGNGHDTQH